MLIARDMLASKVLKPKSTKFDSVHASESTLRLNEEAVVIARFVSDKIKPQSSGSEKDMLLSKASKPKSSISGSAHAPKATLRLRDETML